MRPVEVVADFADPPGQARVKLLVHIFPRSIVA
jgi:hypothetical protein